MEISVIITNYNYGSLISRAIRSALNQSYNNCEYEIIVIDDCSGDSSKTVLDSFGGKIKTIYNEKNEGLAASCNKAIKNASGKYVIRLDADDYVAKDWLLLHHAFLSNNKMDMDATSSDYFEVDLKENILRRRNGITYPIACGIMYRTDHIIDIGLYDETLPREDVEFRKLFLRKYHIYNIPVPLYRYTMHTESKTRNHDVESLNI